MNATRTMTEFPLGAIQNPVIDKQFSTDGLRMLDIDVNALGNLYIRFDAKDVGSIVAAGDDHLIPERIERHGKTLSIKGTNLPGILIKGQKQKLLMEIHVPRETKLRLRMMAGVVILDGGTGDVDIKGWFGEVTGVSEAEKLKVRLYAGEVTLNDIPAKASIQVLLGSLTLGWSQMSGEEQIQAACAIGGLDLKLPAGLTPRDEKGGFWARKRIKTSDGSRIKSWVGLGGLDVEEWAEKPKQKRMIQID